MTRLAILAGALALAGCASTPCPVPVPKIVTQTVQVPVPVRCAPQLAPDPRYGDSDAELKALPGAEDRYQALAVARPLHYAREAELKAALQGCAG